MNIDQFERVTLPVDDGSTLVGYLRSGTGMPVVFLHDLTFSAAYWSPVIAELLHHNLDNAVLVIDARGHGASECAGETSRKRLVKDLKLWCKALQLQDPCLVGHGWGADIALASDVAGSVVAINPLLGRSEGPLPEDVPPPALPGAISEAVATSCRVGAVNAKILKRSRRDPALLLIGAEPLDTSEPNYIALQDVATDWANFQCGSRHLPIEYPVGIAALVLSWIEEA